MVEIDAADSSWVVPWERDASLFSIEDASPTTTKRYKRQSFPFTVRYHPNSSGHPPTSPPPPTTPRWSLFHNRLVLWMLWIDYSFIPLYWRERVMHSGFFFLIVAHFPELIVIMSGFIKWSHFSVPIQHRHRKWAWSIRQFFSPHPKQHNRRNHNNK